MLVDSTLRSGKKDVDDYISSLEALVLTYQGSKSRKLIRSIDNLAGKLSESIDQIADDGKDVEGKEVELSGKHVDTYLKLVEKVDKITNFIKVVQTMDDLELEEPAATEEIAEVPAAVKGEPVNLFELKQIERMKKNGTFKKG